MAKGVMASVVNVTLRGREPPSSAMAAVEQVMASAHRDAPRTFGFMGISSSGRERYHRAAGISNPARPPGLLLGMVAEEFGQQRVGLFDELRSPGAQRSPFFHQACGGCGDFSPFLLRVLALIGKRRPSVGAGGLFRRRNFRHV